LILINYYFILAFYFIYLFHVLLNFVILFYFILFFLLISVTGTLFRLFICRKLKKFTRFAWNSVIRTKINRLSSFCSFYPQNK